MKMRRREKIILTAVLLSAGLYVMQLVPAEWRQWALVVLGVVTYILSALALFDDLQLHEWVTILPFPVVFTVAVGAFYFLLPSSFLSQIVILVVFGLGMYAILLTCNIFSVSKGRTIQLHNAAVTTASFFAMVTSLLLMNTVFSLNLPFWLNALAAVAIHFPLFYTLSWAINLESRIFGQALNLAALGTLLVGELTLILSFLPLADWATALIVMMFFYLEMGVIQNYLSGKLVKRTVNEHVFLAIAVVILMVILFPLK